MSTNLSVIGLVNNGVVHQFGGGSLFTTGTVYYVDSTIGSDGNNGTHPSTPLRTIGEAQTRATASAGDLVLIEPGYTETRTTALTLSKAGVSYIGLGEGSLAPVITVNATVDGISVTGANVVLNNFRFAAPETDDATAMINVAAANCKLINIFGIGSQTSKNFVDGITVASGGDDLTISNLRIYNTVVDMTSGISLEAAVARPVITNSSIIGTFATSCLMDEATSTLGRFENLLLKNTKTTGTTFNFTNNSTGVMRWVHSSGRNTTIASNYVLGTGMDFFEHRLVEEAALNGAILPAADTE